MGKGELPRWPIQTIGKYVFPKGNGIRKGCFWHELRGPTPVVVEEYRHRANICNGHLCEGSSRTVRSCYIGRCSAHMFCSWSVQPLPFQSESISEECPWAFRSNQVHQAQARSPACVKYARSRNLFSCLTGNFLIWLVSVLVIAGLLRQVWWSVSMHDWAGLLIRSSNRGEGLMIEVRLSISPTFLNLKWSWQLS